MSLKTSLVSIASCNSKQKQQSLCPEEPGTSQSDSSLQWWEFGVILLDAWEQNSRGRGRIRIISPGMESDGEAKGRRELRTSLGTETQIPSLFPSTEMEGNVWL